MKEADYIAATNLANLRGALHLLSNYTHTGEGSDKVRQAYRTIVEVVDELSEAGLASGDEPESEPVGDGAYTPDVVFPPGETIRELMEEQGITMRQFRDAMLTAQIGPDRLLDGERRIDARVADLLHVVFGVPAQVWRNLDAAYVRWLESKRENPSE